MNPKISIIVPVYNVEEFLEQCITSIIRQTYENIEVILVNDGSTDNSGVLCDYYADKYNNIKVIHQVNAGLSEARNIGLREASGEYIYFLDSDDYIAEKAIEILVQMALAYKADIVYFDAKCIDENGNEIKTNKYIRTQSYAKPKLGSIALFELLTYQDFYTCVPMLFIRKKSMRDLTFIPGILHEDVAFTYSLFYTSNCVIHVPCELYYRRYRNGSIMSKRTSVKSITSMLIVINEINKVGGKSEISRKCRLLELSLLYKDLVDKYHKLKFADKIKCKEDYEQCIHIIQANGVKTRYLLDISRVFIKSIIGEKNTEKILDLIYKRRIKKNTLKYLTFNKSQNSRLFLIGTPIHGNIGDHLIAEAELQMLHKHTNYDIIEIPMRAYTSHRIKIRRRISKNDIIAISGGGWLGNVWMLNEIAVRHIFHDFRSNRIIMFPQTVYYDENVDSEREINKSKKIYASVKKASIFLRDRRSYYFCTKNELFGKNKCYLCPDMAMYYSMQSYRSVAEKKEIIFCFRRDKERILSSEDAQTLREYLIALGTTPYDSTTVYQYGIDVSERKKALDDILSEFSKAKLVITDRLHCMIICALLGVSCIAFDNYTKKVSGVYEWLKHLNYIRIVDCVYMAEMEARNVLNNIKDCSYTIDYELYRILIQTFRGE